MPAKPTFSHLDKAGNATMVDVSQKPVQFRKAIAQGRLVCKPATITAIRKSALPKGDVLTVSKIAAVQAAKRTADLIPLCHPLPIEHIDVSFRIRKSSIEIECGVVTTGRTGVEMEALTATAVAALTLYDMCKAVDKGMRIEAITLKEKLKQ